MLPRAVAALVLFAACRSGTDRAAAQREQQRAPPGPTDLSAPPRCDLPPGRTDTTIEVAGVQRRYVIHVGRALESPPAVVFAWHGFGGEADRALAMLRPRMLWDDAIAIAPQGEPRTFERFGDVQGAGWQIAAGELGDRDLALFDALVEHLAQRGCLDRTRVYSTGFSNGGFFTNLLACKRGDRIAAAAPGGGGGPLPPECGTAKVPMLITHGRGDDVVDFASAERSFAHWAAHNGCRAVPAGPACTEAEACPVDAPVRLCAHEGGHSPELGQPERAATFLRAYRRE